LGPGRIRVWVSGAGEEKRRPDQVRRDIDWWWDKEGGAIQGTAEEKIAALRGYKYEFLF